MSVVFEGELRRGEEVIVFAEAEENWEIPWLDSCTVEGLLSLESNFRPKVSFKDVFTEEDAEKILQALNNDEKKTQKKMKKVKKMKNQKN